MTPFNAVESALFKGLDFGGRASRGEFWWFAIVFWCALAFAVRADTQHFQSVFTGFTAKEIEVFLVRVVFYGQGWPKELSFHNLWSVYALAVCFIPFQSLTARRLHDAGYSSRFMVMIWGPPALLGTCLATYGAVDLDVAAINRLLFTEARDTLIINVAAVGLGYIALLFVLAVMLMQPTVMKPNPWGMPNFYDFDPYVEDPATPLPQGVRDPFAGYTHLARYELRDNAEAEAARREQVLALYQERVLGRAEANDGEFASQ